MSQRWIARLAGEPASGEMPQVRLHAAILAANETEARQAAVSHLRKTGHARLQLARLASLEDWAREFPHAWDLLGLARQVHEGRPVILSADAVDDGPLPPVRPEWLTLPPARRIERLDLQQGVLPRRNVPEDIHDDLFGGTGHSYAVLDAAKVPMLPELLETSGLAYTSLFKGAAAEKLVDVAPYLVRLRPDSDFTRRLFTVSSRDSDLAEGEVGVFLRSRADLDQICRHLRYFTRLRDENGQWLYFRFWSGSHLFAVFEGLHKGRISDFTQFFETRHARLDAIAHLSRDGHWHMARCVGDIAHGHRADLLSPAVRQELSRHRNMDFVRRLTAYLDSLALPLAKGRRLPEDFVHSAVRIAASHGLRIEKTVADYTEAWVRLGARPEDHPQIAGILATGRHPLDKARDILRLAKDMTKGQAA